jgi:hypothetical protein
MTELKEKEIANREISVTSQRVDCVCNIGLLALFSSVALCGNNFAENDWFGNQYTYPGQKHKAPPLSVTALCKITNRIFCGLCVFYFCGVHPGCVIYTFTSIIYIYKNSN